MGTRNDAFAGTERGKSRDSDVGLGLGMQDEEETCPYKNFMPMLHPHHQFSSPSSSSSYSYSSSSSFGGGWTSGGSMFCNASNCQAPCMGDMYDVVGAASASDPSFAFSSSGGEMAAPINVRVPFTAVQWQELERQTTIYKYMMASLPVPPELLVPITRNSTNNLKGSLELGISGHSSDPEPWRCRRTDGKKWRCSRDVAPDQKYCERHSHKSRPRSRKPVELPTQFISNATTHHRPHALSIAPSTTKPNPTPRFFNKISDAPLPTTPFEQPRCLEWFVKGETSVPLTAHSNQCWQGMNAERTHYGESINYSPQNCSDRDQLNLQAHQQLNNQGNPSLASLEEVLKLKRTHSQETRSFIDAWSRADRDVATLDGSGNNFTLSSKEKLPLSSLTLSMSSRNSEVNQGSHENEQMGSFGIVGLPTEHVRAFKPHLISPAGSWMDSSSTPGGPLAEALCLGMASSGGAKELVYPSSSSPLIGSGQGATANGDSRSCYAEECQGLKSID